MVFGRLLLLCFLHLGACPAEVCVRHYGTRGGVSDSVWEDIWRFREDFTVKKHLRLILNDKEKLSRRLQTRRKMSSLLTF